MMRFIFLGFFAILFLGGLMAALPHKAASSIGSEFTLTDQSGQAFDSKTLKGKYRLVYFGFSHCPDICPIDLALISQVMERLEKKGCAGEIQPIFISLDPERDTPQVLSAYMKSFHPSIRALTGGQKEVDQIAASYKVFHEKQGDNVQHSGNTYFMDRDGNYLRHFGHPPSPDDMEFQLVQQIKTCR